MIENFMRMMKAPHEAMPSHLRAVYMPGISVTVGEMYDAFESVCGKDRLPLLRTQKDEEAERLLNSWPQRANFGKAKRIGLMFDENCTQTFQEYVVGLKS